MRYNLLKKLLCAGLISGSLLIGSFAEAGVVTDRLPLQCYCDHQVNTYNSPGAAKRAGYISANVDMIKILEVRGDGWCRGSYPSSGGKTVTRWFRITDVCADAGYTNRSANVKGNQTVYRTSSGGATIGSVSNNESVIVVADNGSRAQIVYRLDNGTGYKMGWVPSSAVTPAVQGHNPEGNFDFLASNNPKQITVQGWAADRDDMGKSLKIHVYVGGPAGSGAESCEITANKSRPDVQRHFVNQGVPAGEYYGFYETINVTQRTGNQPVYVYAINVGGGNNVELGHKTVNISPKENGNHNPQGAFESYGTLDNALRVIGWAKDDDDLNHKVRVHVYIGGTAGDANAYSKEIRADKASNACPGHGFDETLWNIPDRYCGRQTVRLYAMNDVGGGAFQEIGSKVIDIPPIKNPPVSSDVTKKLEQLANTASGYKMGTKYTGSGQCRGFANKVYLATFKGVQYISGYTNSNYGAASFSGSHEVGRLFNFGTGATGDIKALFAKARPGDFVQMGRRYTLNSTRTAPSPHSAIIYSISDSGVQFYEANTDGKNTIKVNSYSWSDLANKNKGFTIYEPNSYELK